MLKDTRKYIKSLLYDYGRYDDYIARRRYLLEHPLQPDDENVGGGRAKNKFTNPVLTMMITIDKDERLNNLKIQHDAIRKCYEEADEGVQIICQELYFKKKEFRIYASIDALCNSHMISSSISSAYRMFNKFLDTVAKELHLGVMYNDQY